MRRFLARLLPLGGFLGLAAVLITQSTSMDWAAITKHPAGVFQALFLFVLPVIFGFIGWWLLLNRAEKVLDAPTAYRLFGLSWLSRYMPGGTVWQYVALGVRSESKPIAVAAISAYFFSTLLGLMAGFLIGFVLLSTVLHHTASLPIQIVGLTGVLIGFWVLTEQRLFESVTARFQRWVPAVKDLIAIQPGVALTVLLGNLISWTAQAAGAYALWMMVTTSNEPDFFLFFLACYCVSFLGAYFTFLTPSGVGLRESGFALLLATKIPTAEATFVALGTGFGLFIAEAIFMIPLLLKPRNA